MTDHICPEPGCGMLEERVLVERRTTSHDEHYIYECPRNADAHALCARVAELEAAVVELWDLLRECSDEDANEEGVDHLYCGSESCSNFVILNRYRTLRESLGALKLSFQQWNIARQEGGTP